MSAFSIRFSNTRSSSSRSPSTASGRPAPSRLISTSRSRASVCKPSTTCRMMATSSTRVSGRRCALSSMRDSDSRSSIRRAMRVACACMIARNRVARRRIVARRALQGLDEARQRGQRRAQFVAGIGDEVGAHLLDPPQRRQVVERDQHQAAGRWRRGDPAIRHHDRLVPALDRHALDELDPLRRCRSRRARRIASRTSGTRNAERNRLAAAQAPARSRWRGHSAPAPRPGDRARSPGAAARPAPIRSVARRPVAPDVRPAAGPTAMRHRPAVARTAATDGAQAPPGPAPRRALRTAKSRRARRRRSPSASRAR